MRNIVVCCDGTRGKYDVAEQNTNVVRLFERLGKDGERQISYYDPGVGTYSPMRSGPARWVSKWVVSASGVGLTQQVYRRQSQRPLPIRRSLWLSVRFSALRAGATRKPNYTFSKNLITKVLDFDQLGGPGVTRTIDLGLMRRSRASSLERPVEKAAPRASQRHWLPSATPSRAKPQCALLHQ